MLKSHKAYHVKIDNRRIVGEIYAEISNKKRLSVVCLYHNDGEYYNLGQTYDVLISIDGIEFFSGKMKLRRSSLISKVDSVIIWKYIFI